MLQEVSISNNHLSTNTEPMSSIDSAFIDSYMHHSAPSPVAQSIYYNNLSTLNTINSNSNNSTAINNMIGSSLSTTSASNCVLPAISSLYSRDTAQYYTGKEKFILKKNKNRSTREIVVEFFKYRLAFEMCFFLNFHFFSPII